MSTGSAVDCRPPVRAEPGRAMSEKCGGDLSMRKERATRARRGLAAILLTATCLTSLLALGAGPALADGGAGGPSFFGQSGGAGAPGFVGNSGTTGSNAALGGGGGGGGGAGGGDGGAGGSNGSGGIGGAAGTGGTLGSPNGGNGGDGFQTGPNTNGGGGGGGGGFNGTGVGGAPSINITTSLTGGNGGAGGANGGNGWGGAGGGGAGGYGAVVTGGGASSNTGSIVGGNGGAGGSTNIFAPGGNGGDGGVSVQFTAGGAIFINTGTVAGGSGGAGGTGSPSGAAGAGGAGIVGGGLTVINSGSITGGMSGAGAQANAITFSGGANVLELQAGSTISGNVVAFSAADTLRLGGAAGGSSFAVSQIGGSAQYRGFGAFEKTGTSTWTLIGTTTAVTPWAINAGRVFVTNDANLGAASGGLAFGGGELWTLETITMSRAITINAGGATFNPLVNTTLTLDGIIDGAGNLTKRGQGTVELTGNNTYMGGTTIRAGNLAVTSDANLGAAAGTLTFADGGELWVRANIATGRTVTINSTSIGGFDVDPGVTLTLNGAVGGSGDLAKFGAGTLVLAGSNTYLGRTAIVGGTLSISGDGNLGDSGGALVFRGGTLQTTGNFSTSRATTLNAGGGTFDTASGTALVHNGAIDGTGGLTKSGAGTLTLTGANSYGGGTKVTGGLINFAAGNNLSTGAITLNGGGLQWATGNTTDISSRLTALGPGGGTFDTNGNTVTLASAITGTGVLAKQGAGTLILSGTSSYTGGTTVSGGVLQGNTASLQGNILNNAAVTFDQATSGAYAGNMSGTGALTVQGGGTLILSGTNSYAGGTTVSGGVLQGNTTSLQGNILNNASVVFDQTGSGTYAGIMSGTGGMTLQGGGVLTLAGNNLYTGPTTVTGSGLIVNGSLASAVALDASSAIGGTGTIGGLVSNGATLAPGNSIGTLTVSGSFAQTGGTYQVEVNSAGQSDRINVTGAPGTATINGGTVQVIAAPGSYGNSTTYTILNATGGVAGTYSGVNSNFAFLTPSLTYNANNVFLTLALQGNAFSGFGGNTANQRSVGFALDQSFANATGDFATVIGALAGLNTQQGPWALNQISGQPYADFGTFNIANNALFMNALGQQMALARGGAGSGQRQALAKACEVEACDDTSPFSVWVSGLGGLGSVQGNGNSSTFTYNVGGTAAGIDYRVTPSALVGVSAGYTNGTQWVDSFQGKGWSNSVSVAVYGSFTQSGLYVDALAGYAYSNNQLQRQISIPNLQPRTANGSTGANQFLGQAEAGYRIGIYVPADATVTPFVRFQASSIDQAAFSEWGANSLSLDVEQQTTTSIRTTLGADLAGAIDLDDTRTLALGLRLGWLHEYAGTARPLTAAFAGAPSAAFTVYGATLQRDAAVIGFQASTDVATATQLYLRYDGEIGSGSDNHTLNVGLRLSW
jgi:fibronectin-binding autotransporter adhesin